MQFFVECLKNNINKNLTKILNRPFKKIQIRLNKKRNDQTKLANPVPIQIKTKNKLHAR